MAKAVEKSLAHKAKNIESLAQKAETVTKELAKKAEPVKKKVVQKGLIRQLKGAAYADSFDSDQGIDVVSGATYTSIAIIECAKVGSRQIAKEELGLKVPTDIKTKFSLGIPEIALVLLYLVALAGVYTSFPYKKMLRWITLVAGLVILGFWFSLPLTLSRVNLFLIGFWPDWHDHLYWYILVYGFFLILLVTRKNIYCSWICPLGCIQDGIGLVGQTGPGRHRITLLTTGLIRLSALLILGLPLTLH